MFVVERRGKYSSNLHTLYTIEEREIEYGNIILNSLISGCKQLRENNLFFSVKKTTIKIIALKHLFLSTSKQSHRFRCC